MNYFILVAGVGCAWSGRTNGLAACKRLLQLMGEYPSATITLYRGQEIITEVIR